MNEIERYERIAQIMDEAYRSYEDGLAALRQRVVADMRRKLREGGIRDQRRERLTLRSSPTRRRR